MGFVRPLEPGFGRTRRPSYVFQRATRRDGCGCNLGPFCRDLRPLDLFEFGQPKVGQQRAVSGAVVQDVARFEIAMQDALLMQFVQRPRHRFEQSRGTSSVDRPRLQQVLQRPALNERHHKVGETRVFADIVDLDHMIADDHGGGPRLATKPSGSTGIVGGYHPLECRQITLPLATHEIDDPHPAAPQLPLDEIRPDQAAVTGGRSPRSASIRPSWRVARQMIPQRKRRR